MAISETDMREAEDNMAAARRAGIATSARYDRRRGRIVITLDTGVEITFPPQIAEDLADAPPEQLSVIEITPSGLGLHWPNLDADLYVPALLQGVFGSKRWMAATLGAVGGKARSPAKASAARENGRKGGRPRKVL